MNAATIDSLANASVLVVGDVMLDRFVHGRVTRISREAPVPIFGRGETDAHPGGACNVAANILSCGGRTTMVGLIGEDEAGQELLSLCRSFAGMTAKLIEDASRPTTVKTRYLSGWQQLLCVDTEDRNPASPAIADGLLEAAGDAMNGAGVVVVSDYGRGALTPTSIGQIIREARSAGLPVIVDPRHDDPAVYDGASVVTPNIGEMEKFTGLRVTDDDSAVEACEAVLAGSHVDAVLLTRGPGGMTLLERGASPVHVAAQTHSVFDVTGAGDTVVAVLAAALAGGAKLADAMQLANIAAGIVVAKPGTAVIYPRELREALGAITHREAASWADAAETVSLWQGLGLTVGFTNGCFDLLHRGHLHSLEEAAARCDRLVVGVNSDASTSRLKGPTRPVHDQDSRAAVLSALRSVDLVAIFDEDTPEDLIRALGPDRLFKGADYEGQEIPGADFVRERGGKVELLPLLEGFSTTRTVEKLRS